MVSLTVTRNGKHWVLLLLPPKRRNRLEKDPPAEQEEDKSAEVSHTEEVSLEEEHEETLGEKKVLMTWNLNPNRSRKKNQAVRHLPPTLRRILSLRRMMRWRKI